MLLFSDFLDWLFLHLNRLHNWAQVFNSCNIEFASFAHLAIHIIHIIASYTPPNRYSFEIICLLIRTILFYSPLPVVVECVIALVILFRGRLGTLLNPLLINKIIWSFFICLMIGYNSDLGRNIFLSLQFISYIIFKFRIQMTLYQA